MTLPPVLSEWAASRGIHLTPRARDGRIAFNVDGAYRIYVYPAPDSTLMLESRILDLPMDANTRERMVFDSLTLATARMRNHSSRLTVDEQQTMLLLQTELRSDEGMQTLTDTLTDFVNCLAEWRVRLQS